jgi:hypothetical protein
LSSSGQKITKKEFFFSDELVQDGVNGRIFTSGPELSAILIDWFAGFPATTPPQHQLFRHNLAAFRQLGWRENWRTAALPIFQSLDGKSAGSGLVIGAFFLGLFLALASFLPTVQ